MTRHFLIGLFAVLVLASCSPSAQQKAAEIEKLETELKESGKLNKQDKNHVKQLMNDYQYYIKAFPDDSLTPVYLMRVGEFYRASFSPDSAIYCYSQVYTRFPAYPKANVALFLEAFTLANEKHNYPMAKTLYEEYLSKYPNTHMAKSVQSELKNLGKTPDQIMAELDSTNRLHKDTIIKRP